MYNRDPLTLFELAGNQRDGNPVPLSLSRESMTIGDHVTQMEHIYLSMLAKAQQNIKIHIADIS